MVAAIPILCAVVGFVIGWNTRGLTERLRAGRGSGLAQPALGADSASAPPSSSTDPSSAEPQLTTEALQALREAWYRKYMGFN
jgi:hypothetical protein